MKCKLLNRLLNFLLILKNKSGKQVFKYSLNASRNSTSDMLNKYLYILRLGGFCPDISASDWRSDQVSASLAFLLPSS